MTRYTDEEKKNYWKNKKEDLQKLIKEKQHLIYNPNIEGSKSRIKYKHKVSEQNEYIRTLKINIELDEEGKKLMLCWLDATTEMYNLVQEVIKETIEDEVQDKQLLKELLNYQIARTKYFKEVRDKIKDESNIRFIKKNFQYSDRKDNLIYTHTLDAAIKQCCSNFKSMLTNKKKKHIENFTVTALDYSRKFRVLEFDARCFNKGSKLYKIFPSLIAKRGRKNFDLTSIKCASLLRYNSLADSFTLLVPVKEKIIDQKEIFNTISIDPGVRSPLTCITDDAWFSVGKGVTKRIVREIDKLDEIQQRKIDSKVKKKLRRRIKYQLTNYVEDFHWIICKLLTDACKTIIIGDINIKSIVSNDNSLFKKQKRILSFLSLRKLISRLKYKCESKNVNFYLIDESFTSKLCSQCSWFNEKLGTSKVFECKECSNVMKRDVNAARNIMIKSLA